MLPTDVDLTAELHEPGSHGSTMAYLTSLWRRRGYAWHVPLSELRGQQMNTVLGNFWHLLNPALSIAVYFLVFGVVLEADRGVENYLAFLTVGVSVYQFTTKATMRASNSIIRSYGLLRTISFPRALLPISAVISEAMAFVMVLVVMLATVLLTGEPLRWSWVFIIPLALFQLLFNIGAGLVAARATSSFRDIENVLPFVFRLLFYGSGVLFSVSAFLEEDRSQWQWIFTINPLFCLIELQRWAVLGQDISLSVLTSLLLWTTVLVLGGFTWFRRAEARYGA